MRRTHVILAWPVLFCHSSGKRAPCWLETSPSITVGLSITYPPNLHQCYCLGHELGHGLKPGLLQKIARKRSSLQLLKSLAVRTRDTWSFQQPPLHHVMRACPGMRPKQGTPRWEGRARVQTFETLISLCLPLTTLQDSQSLQQVDFPFWPRLVCVSVCHLLLQCFWERHHCIQKIIWSYGFYP